METIAQRIETRLKALGKNPSRVALEAGLGRSSVRDILVGKVASPRLETLQKLTGPLECDLEYLTGTAPGELPPIQPKPEDGYFDSVEVNRMKRIEIGVFRTAKAREKDISHENTTSEQSKRYLVYNDFRLKDHFFDLFEMGDYSLSDLHILPGDHLTVATPHMDDVDIVPLRPGTIVLIRRRLPRLHQPELEELSARLVDIRDGNVTLTTKSSIAEHDEIVLADIPEYHQLEAEKFSQNTYFTKEGMITVVGLVVRLTRMLPI